MGCFMTKNEKVKKEPKEEMSEHGKNCEESLPGNEANDNKIMTVPGGTGKADGRGKPLKGQYGSMFWHCLGVLSFRGLSLRQ